MRRRVLQVVGVSAVMLADAADPTVASHHKREPAPDDLRRAA